MMIRRRGLLNVVHFVVTLLLAMTLTPTTAVSADIEGRVTVRGARDNRDVVVYIDKIPGKRFPPPAAPAKLNQLNLTFVPHILPILAGTTVIFPNSDEILHNVFSPIPKPGWNLKTYPRPEFRLRTFDTPGPVTLLCNVHAEMSAYVIVTETPYFAVSDKDGKFVISGVPPGKYTLKVWHEKNKAPPIELEVPNSGNASMAFELKR